MIEALPEPLSKESEKALRIWLAKPERKTLELIISSRVKKLEAEALKHAIGGGGNGEKLFESTVREARRYDGFLEVLKEIIEAPKLEIVKVK